jgi:hypothetical protein
LVSNGENHGVHMSYVHEICDPLVKIFEHATSLETHRLAGYSANLDFWVSEVEHRLGVLRGYPERHRHMSQATKSFAKSAGNIATPTVSRSVSDQEIWELGERIIASLRLFLNRCQHEGLINENMMSEIATRLKVDFEKE